MLKVDISDHSEFSIHKSAQMQSFASPCFVGMIFQDLLEYLSSISIENI